MDYPREFVEALVTLSGGLPADRGLEDTLARVAELATQQIAGCDFAGCTLVRDGKATTAVFTDPLSPEIDSAQYASGRGPCLDATVMESCSAWMTRTRKPHGRSSRKPRRNMVFAAPFRFRS